MAASPTWTLKASRTDLIGPMLASLLAPLYFNALATILNGALTTAPGVHVRGSPRTLGVMSAANSNTFPIGNPPTLDYHPSGGTNPLNSSEKSAELGSIQPFFIPSIRASMKSGAITDCC